VHVVNELDVRVGTELVAVDAHTHIFHHQFLARLLFACHISFSPVVKVEFKMAVFQTVAWLQEVLQRFRCVEFLLELLKIGV